jgi:hypothetical protein
MLIGLILNLFYINLFNPFFNACVFQMSSKNKVDLVLVDVPSNFLIPHGYEPLSFIPPWNRQVDNFFKSTVFFVKFLFDKGVVIIMHVDDL